MVIHRPWTGKHAHLEISAHDEYMRTSSLRPRVQVAALLASIVIVLAQSPPAFAYVDPSTGLPAATGVVRGADIPEHDWLPGHRGVDLALKVGDVVRAAGDGEVVFSGQVAGTPVVSLEHGDGIHTTYQPVHARVARGDTVKEGEVIGILARPTGDHVGLHWGARTGPKEYINPLSLLESPTIRLKPVDEPARRPA